MYQILTEINQVILILFVIAFATQLIYVLFFFLPVKKYKHAKNLHKVAIVISARNEEKVIGDLLLSLNNLNYPKSQYDIYVIADNCTDNTSKIAQENGATVFERYDSNPKHHRLSYALKFGFEAILNLNIQYDFYVKFDADNIVDSNYLIHMNDAYASGSKLAKGYNNAKNLDDNVIACISGLWYIRDNRFSCHVRSALHLSQLLTGPGMMIASSIIEKNNGWKQMGISEDVDFTLDELLQGRSEERRVGKECRWRWSHE